VGGAGQRLGAEGLALSPSARPPTEPSADGRWTGLLRAGAAAAAAIAILLIGEIAVFAAFPRPPTALAHLELFARSPVVGLLTLDLLGMVAYLLFVPVILAVYVAVHRWSEGVAAVAVVLFVIGVAASSRRTPGSRSRT
jgi:hypothetical protein